MDDRGGETPRPMFDNVCAPHRVIERDDAQTLLYVDRHLVHDGSASAFASLKRGGLKLRAPERTFATPDHYVLSDTHDITKIPDPERRGMVEQLIGNTATHGVTLFGVGDKRQGIVH